MSSVRAQYQSDQTQHKPVEVLSPNGVEVSQSGTILFRYSGNVKIRHQGILLFCDEALLNKTTNQILAYGHVLLVQGDSITAKSDTITYDGNDQQATLRGRIMFQDRQVVLTTHQLSYHLPSGMAHYPGKSRIATGKTVLTGRDGYYSVQARQFTAQPVVRVAETNDTLRAKPVVVTMARLPTADTASKSNSSQHALLVREKEEIGHEQPVFKPVVTAAAGVEGGRMDEPSVLKTETGLQITPPASFRPTRTPAQPKRTAGRRNSAPSSVELITTKEESELEQELNRTRRVK